MSLPNPRIALTFDGDWLDKSGNGNDVTPSGIILKTDTPKIGSGYTFGDGINDDGEIADSPSLDADFITVACWVRYTTSTTTLPVERSGGGNIFDDGDWGFATTSGKLRFQVHVGGANRRSDSPLTYNDGDWHLMIGMYDGSYVRVFVDNIYVAGLAASHGVISATSDPLTLFARIGKIIPFPGSMDSFFLFGEALSFGGVSVGQQATGQIAEIWDDGAGIGWPLDGEIPLIKRGLARGLNRGLGRGL